jgi:hypothetical protein
MRWLIVFLVALLLFNHFGKWMEKLGLGRLPGDFRFRIFGRQFFIPLASSIVLSMVATLVTLLF